MVDQDKIVIYLKSDGSTDWLLTNNNYNAIGTTINEHADELAENAVDKEVIVVVPAEDVLITTTKLPKMNRTRLMQALPYALEEQLVSDVDALHFAADKPETDGLLRVAVVAKEKMREWINKLNTLNIKADRMIPLSLLVPFSEHTWHAVLSDVGIVRLDANQCFTCDHNNLNEFLNVALSTATELPHRIYVQNYSPYDYIPALSVPIQVDGEIGEPYALLPDLINNIKQTNKFNLMQGEFAVKKSATLRTKNVIKLLASLAGAWLVLLFLYPTVSYFILKEQVASIDNQIADIYKANFPQATSVIDPKIRMQDKLQKMKEQIGENRFLLLLGYIAKGLSEKPGIQLNRIDFQNNQLTLDIIATTSDNVAFFSNFLIQQGLNVKQENAKLVPAGINATLVVN